MLRFNKGFKRVKFVMDLVIDEDDVEMGIWDFEILDEEDVCIIFYLFCVIGWFLLDDGVLFKCINRFFEEVCFWCNRYG